MLHSGSARALVGVMATILEAPSAASAIRKHLPLCVLDDDSDQVEIITERLDKSGFPTVGTTNPLEALQKVRAGGCRVVVCDLKMPSMDGLDFPAENAAARSRHLRHSRHRLLFRRHRHRRH